MKKLSILLILFTLFSCSKLEENGLFFQIYNANNNIKHSISKNNNIILCEVKINDSLTATYTIGTLNNISYCNSGRVHRVINSKKDTIYKSYFIESLIGSHTIQNNIINGRYTSKNSSDFIEFKNYHL